VINEAFCESPMPPPYKVSQYQGVTQGIYIVHKYIAFNFKIPFPAVPQTFGILEKRWSAMHERTSDVGPLTHLACIKPLETFI